LDLLDKNNYKKFNNHSGIINNWFGVFFFEGEMMKKVLMCLGVGIVVLAAGCTPLENAILTQLFNSVLGL